MLYRDWLNLHTHLLWCHDHPVNADSRSNTHTSSDFSCSAAWLVKEGWAKVVQDDGQSFRAKPGQWLIVKPGKRTQSFKSGTVMLSVAFEAKWPDGSDLFDRGLSLVIDAEKYPKLERKAKPMLNTMRKIHPDTWDARDSSVRMHEFLRLESLLSAWLLTLAETLKDSGVEHHAKMNVDDRVMHAVRLLQSHDMGEILDLEVLAESIGTSQTHLNRLFQRDLQKTPRDYFENIRIEYACNMLKQADKRVNEVAIKMGFTYLSHFSKWFKKHTGVSPRGFKA